jgi:hypothetical protein
MKGPQVAPMKFLAPLAFAVLILYNNVLKRRFERHD